MGASAEKTYPVSHYDFLKGCEQIAAELRAALELLGPAVAGEEHPEEKVVAFDARMRQAESAWRLWFDMDEKPDPETYPPHEHDGPYYDLYWAVADVAERVFDWGKFEAWHREEAARAFLAAFEPIEQQLNPALARPGARVRPSVLAERRLS